MDNLTPEDIFQGNNAAIDSLISDLENIYPPYQATPNDSIAHIMYRSGQRSVIEYLLSLKKDN